MDIAWSVSTEPGFKVGIELTYAPSTVTNATVSVVVTPTIYLDVSGFTGGASNTNGALSGDMAATITATYGTGYTDWTFVSGSIYKYTKTALPTKTVTLAYGATQTSSATASLTFYSTITASQTVTIPARPYVAPAAPTGLTTTYVTDSKFTLAWTNAATAGAPYVNVYVERWDSSSAVWTQVASLGVVTTWSDTTTIADRKYQYRVRAHNTIGYGSYVTGSYVYTTPKVPTNLVATFVSDTSTTLAWSNASSLGTANTNYIERSINGAAWGQIATVAGNVATYAATTSANNTYQFRVRAGNGLYSGYVTSNMVGTTPAAPTGATATYVSDAQINIAWTNVSLVATNVLLERQDYLGTWSLIATLSSTTASYQDKSTVVDRRYAYRVRAVTYTAYSTYSTSATIATTPLAPTNAVAAKSGTNVTITWTNNALTSGNVEIWHAANGVWDGAALSSSLTPTTASYTHAGANTAQTHQYRVRTKSTPSNTVYSAYATTGTVTLLAAPLAPTISLNKTVYDAALGQVTVTWVHNATDSTVQTAAEARVSVLGANTWTTDSALTTQTSKTFTTPVNGNSYEIQVRTKGDYASFGAWSASKIVVASAIPSATITAPGSTITTTAKLTLTWTYYDAESTAQAAWQATLYKGTDLIESRSGISGTSYMFSTVLQNSSSYSVVLKVQDGSGLWSNNVTKAFSTNFVVPPVPVVDAEFDVERGLVHVNVATPAATGGQATPDHVDIYRDDVLIASGLATTVSTIDYIPAINAEPVYTAIAWSLLPTATTSSAVPVDTTSGEWLYLNGGEGFAQLARIKGNAAVQASYGRQKVLHQFAGRTKPVEFIGTARNVSYKLSGQVAGFASKEAELGSWEAFEAVADLPAPIAYRDPLGRKVFVSIGDVSVSHDAKSNLATIDCELTVVDYDEN